MERLQCKACGSFSMLPMELQPEHSEEMDLLNEKESRFFSCHVCGDNWLSVRNVDSGDCSITFVHQMGLQPLLKRVAHMSTPVLLQEETVDKWDYFLGDNEVDENEWRKHLTSRRQILKSICSN
ncbi:MAG: hypothetical protein R3284_02585 [Rubricoccaceae bacterium]|nr:hypothetical protein [Rubricoccaceae bacterium]